VPVHLEDLLKGQGSPVPSPLQGLGLVDTGASVSMVDLDAIASLDMRPVGTATLTTAGGPSQSPLYPVRLGIVLPGKAPVLVAAFSHITAGPLKRQGLLALVGRDILQHGVVFYDGTLGSVTIGF